MKNLKYLIFIVLILVFLIGTTIIVLTIYNKQNQNNNNTISNNQTALNTIQNNIIDIPDVIQQQNKNTDAEIIKEILYDYKEKMLNNPEQAYMMLDEEYKQKRFGNLQTYIQYINKNINLIENSFIQKYGVKKLQDATQYTIVDTNSWSYIIEIDNNGEYKIFADFYTTEIKSIIDKYDESDDIGKAKINVQKIIGAMNTRDYVYIYSKLSEEFKIEMFPTYEEFVTYLDEILIDTVKLEVKDLEEEDNKINLNIILNPNTDIGVKLSMKTIMELKGNRDYVIELEIKEEN